MGPTHNAVISRTWRAEVATAGWDQAQAMSQYHAMNDGGESVSMVPRSLQEKQAALIRRAVTPVSAYGGLGSFSPTSVSCCLHSFLSGTMGYCFLRPNSRALIQPALQLQPVALFENADGVLPCIQGGRQRLSACSYARVAVRVASAHSLVRRRALPG